MFLFGYVSVGGDALLDVEDQPLRAQGPITLRKLAHYFLGQRESTIFRFFCFFLIQFGPENFNQRGAAPSSVIKCLRRGRRLGVIVGIFFVSVGFFLGTLRRSLPVATQFIVDQMEGG